MLVTLLGGNNLKSEENRWKINEMFNKNDKNINRLLIRTHSMLDVIYLFTEAEVYNLMYVR
jgi:hypothetical protein